MEEVHEPQSMLQFFLLALGMKYLLLLSLAALVGFAISVVVVIRGRGPMAATALILAVIMPLLVGIYGAISSTINSFMILSGSDVALKPSELAAGISEALVLPYAGLLFSAPTFLVALFGSFTRALTAPADRS